jgi:uncharacterized protein YkwD
MKSHESTRSRCAVLAELLGAALLLAACGGGGGDTAVPAANAPAPAPAASAPSPGSVAATCNISDFAATALARINQVRAAGANCHTDGVFPPAAALSWNVKLTDAAGAHSADMAAKNYFSHTSTDGRTLGERVNATGYAWNALGENIAAGYVGIDIVMDGWVASDAHCANLMNPNFTEVGLACVPGTSGSTYSTYWTMDLGRPK